MLNLQLIQIKIEGFGVLVNDFYEDLKGKYHK